MCMAVPLVFLGKRNFLLLNLSLKRCVLVQHVFSDFFIFTKG